MQPFTDEYFMQQALLEAQKAFDKDEVPVGAVVVARNRIIARAHNLTESLNDVTAHAEMQAFTAAASAVGGKFLNECALYVTLEPCAMCAGASFWTRIGKIVYGTGDPKNGFSLYSNSIIHPSTTVISGIMQNECAGLLKKFFESKR